MFNYIIKKTFQALLVVVSVLSVVFLLQNHSVIDPVEDYLNSSFGEKTINQETYEQVYAKESRRLNKHLPEFYFGIIPNYFPSDLNEIIIKEDRNFYKELLRYSKCKSCIDDYLEALKKIAVEESLAKDKSILKWNRTKNIHDTQRIINDIKSNTELVKHESIKKALSSWNQFIVKESSFSLPKIVWHGSQNQYHRFMGNLVTGKIGISKTDGRSANAKIMKALRWTLSINITGFILAGVLGLGLGLWSIKYDDTAIEKGVSSIFFFIYTMPVFWIATLLVIFFTTKEYGAWTHLFPSVGIKYWYSDQPVYRQIILNAAQLVLPVICITLPSFAYISRIMKSKFSEVLSLDFVTTLRAKGLSENDILTKHVLRNGLIPYITIMTGAIPGLFAGSLVIEIIFNIPGVGKLLYDSILSSDWVVISGIVIMISFITIFAYLLADILYVWANPKLNLENA